MGEVLGMLILRLRNCCQAWLKVLNASIKDKVALHDLWILKTSWMEKSIQLLYPMLKISQHFYISTLFLFCFFSCLVCIVISCGKATLLTRIKSLWIWSNCHIQSVPYWLDSKNSLRHQSEAFHHAHGIGWTEWDAIESQVCCWNDCVQPNVWHVIGTNVFEEHGEN